MDYLPIFLNLNVRSLDSISTARNAVAAATTNAVAGGEDKHSKINSEV